VYSARMGEVEDCRDQAERCRRLAQAVTDPKIRTMLLTMAGEFDRRAIALERAHNDNDD